MADNLQLFNEPGGVFQYPELGKFFLDCGAFSVLTGTWTELPVEAYISFVIKYQEHISLLAAPDVIGSAEETFAYLRNFVSRMRDVDMWNTISDRVVITYHLVDRDLATFRKMLVWAYDNGVRWVAIGGIAGTGGSKEGKWTAIEALKNIIYNELKLPFKLHLFGGSSLEFTYNFEPDSVDSSTYLAKGKMLGLVWFDKQLGELLGFTTQGYTNDKQVEAILNILRAYKVDMDESGLRDEMLNCPPAIRCMVCNLATVGILERYVQERLNKPHFTYWVSLDSGSFILASSKHGRNIAKLFYDHWRDRCLFSFGTLYEKDGSVSLPWLRTFVAR